MNENSSSNSSTSAPHHGLTAEAISRRAYELWEKEGRPENRDLHHWLRAEQELLAEQQGKAKGQSPGSNAGSDSSRNSDWLAPEKDLLQQNKGQGAAQSAGASRQQNMDQPLQSSRTSAAAKQPAKSMTRSSPPTGTRPPGRS